MVRVQRSLCSGQYASAWQDLLRAEELHPGNPSLAELRAKLTALKAAVGSMERAQAYEPALEPSARNFFYCSWPGWAFSVQS